GVVRAKRPERLPVVLTRAEVGELFKYLDGVPRLVAGILYGAGLRLFEGTQLRVHDLDFARGEIVVRHGKGGKDRRTMLPAALKSELLQNLDRVCELHRRDLARGLGAVPLPEALARKYVNAATEWGWQWLFPAASHFIDRQTGQRHRWHTHDSVIQ